MIGLIFALPREMESFRAKLGPSSGLPAGRFTFYYARVDGQPVVLVKSGIGRERSRRAAESLLKTFNVDAVICAGLAGGVRDRVRTGELIIAGKVLDYPVVGGSGGTAAGYPCHRGLVDLSRKLADESGLEFRCGDLLTVDTVAQPASKKRIGDATSAVAVDMEGTGVAEAAMAAGTPFLALKVVSDEQDDELKGHNLVDGEGDIKPLSVIFYLMKNPPDLIHLLRIRGKTDRALDKLALFLRRFIERYGEVSNPLNVMEK
ncbi:MAG: hypothetical protein NOU37_06580 [Candidatus Brocadiales bacterium]|nr:hypothetical protein [Candidatus Bathyanammoxibius amoris]